MKDAKNNQTLTGGEYFISDQRLFDRFSFSARFFLQHNHCMSTSRASVRRPF